MKKAVNVTTAIALALAASVTYNVVQHQRAKGIRPESPKQEDNQPQTEAGIGGNAAAAGSAVTAVKSASAKAPAAQTTSVTFRSASYDKDNDELDISFSTPSSLQYNVPKNAVVFTPEVDNLSLYAHGSTISVSGKFKPGVTYRVRVKKGLADRSGKATLENDAVFDITIPELTEKLSFLTDGSVFPITEKSVEFPYSARNIRKLDVKLYRAFDNNLNNMSNNYYDWDDRADTSNMLLVGEKTVTLSDPRNETVNHMLDINDILVVNDSNPNTTRLFSATPGYYVLEVAYDRQSDWGDYSYRETKYRNFMLTDFALVAATVSDPAGGIVLYARRISDGNPIADAEIELSSDKNQLLAKGKTDASGKVVFHVSQNSIDRLHAGENDSNFLNRTGQFGSLYSATIRKGKEFAWFPLDLYLGKNDLTPRAFAFSERGIVRPGESFLAAAFIRDRTDAELEIGHETADASGKEGKNEMGSVFNSETTPVTLTVVAPDGKEIFSKQLTPDKNGFVSSEVRIPENAASGYYTFRFGVAKRIWGESHIQVGTYVPDRIRTKLEHAPLPAGPAAVKEPIQAVLSADYYFGTPVPSASGKVYFDCFANGKRPDHWKDWTVGDASRFNFDEYNTTISVENGKTNLSLPSFGSRGISFDPVRVVLQASVQEPGERAVTGSDNFTLYPSDWFIGLKEKEGAGNECLLDLALLATEQGKAASLNDGRDIRFTVYKRSWDYVLVQEGDGYRRRWKETVSEVEGASKTFTVPQGADLAAFTSQVAFDLPSGCYDIVAEYGNDIRTKLNVWHSAGESGRRTGDPSGLVFKTDAKTYTPGQTAKLTFTSPFDGEAFVAMGGTKLDSSSTFQVKTGENTVEAKIPADCLNGIFHVGVFAVGKQNGEYMRASGDASLKLDHSAAHKLNVGIELPGIVRPETEAEVSISLASLDGKPADGQVCLFAVDEGVLALTGFKTPDIYKFFLQADDSFISMSETYSRLFPNLKIRPDGTIGGGDDAGAALKASLVKMKDAVRIIEPAVAVSNGTGKVKVKIPDHSGSLRFMAVASSPDAVGSGEREMIVRSPVSLTVSAPRVLAPGDEAVISVRAFNHDAKDGAVKFDLALPDTLQLAGDKPRIDSLKAGETKDISFRVKATDTLGEGTLAATLSVGAEKRTETTYITVRQPNPPQTVTEFVSVAPGKDFTLDLNGEFTSVDSATLSVSSSPALGVKDALGWLNDYPYGCLEQTVSGAFPFIAVQPLVKAGLLDAEVAKTMQPKVPAAYARILSMLAGDGAFSMWPDVRKEWPEGTVYAAHFIFEADAAKLISVDAAVRRDVTAYLLRLANTAGMYKPELRAYAAYVLASAGSKDFVIPARNVLAGSKPGFAQFLAAAALIRGGYAGEGAEPLRKSLADTAWLYGDSPAVGMYDAASRAGMVLDILMKCDPKGNKDAAAKLAAFLAGRIRKDGNCWGTTQSNAWASMGLAAFAEYYPPVKANGKFTFEDRLEEFTDAIKKNVANGESSVKNTGSAEFFVQTVVKGVPKNARSASGPVRLNREFFNEKGEPVTSLKHGELAFVRITVDAPDVVEDLVVSDILPAGLEIEDEELTTRMRTSSRIPNKIRLEKRHFFDRTEKRDDRFLAFGTLYESAYAIYTVRAVTPGKFAVPALHAEAMYDPDMNGTFIPSAGQDVFEVK
jgi:uncharacterized protein YfaS (alpha-2-macroglobulin family)